MIYYESDHLMHHGIKGQKWGVRRFQNTDGTYNKAGKKRYFGSSGLVKNFARRAKVLGADAVKAVKKEQRDTPEAKATRAEKLKKTAVVGASIAAAGLSIYGGYKLYSNQKESANKIIEYEKQLARKEAGEKALRALYDKQIMNAFNDPNVFQAVIRDDSINYYNSFTKKR